MEILFSQDSTKKTTVLSDETVKDIALYEVIEHMSTDAEERKFLKKLMTAIPCEPKDIIFRQQILKDLLDNEELCHSMKQVLENIKTLKHFGGIKKAASDRDTTLYTLLETLRELVVYVDVIEELDNLLSENKIESDGLIALRDYIHKVITDEKFSVAKSDIQKMHEDLSNVRGAVIGVNFTPELDIENVTAIEFVPHGIRSKYTLADVALLSKASNPFNKFKNQDPLLAAITPKMEKHLKLHFFEIKRTLSKYVDYDNRFLIEMYEGLSFYIRSAELGRKLKSKDYEISFPEITGTSDSTLDLKGFYNIRLAFFGESNIVKNDSIWS